MMSNFKKGDVLICVNPDKYHLVNGKEYVCEKHTKWGMIGVVECPGYIFYPQRFIKKEENTMVAKYKVGDKLLNRVGYEVEVIHVGDTHYMIRGDEEYCRSFEYVDLKYSVPPPPKVWYCLVNANGGFSYCSAKNNDDPNYTNIYKFTLDHNNNLTMEKCDA